MGIEEVGRFLEKCWGGVSFVISRNNYFRNFVSEWICKDFRFKEKLKFRIFEWKDGIIYIKCVKNYKIKIVLGF